MRVAAVSFDAGNTLLACRPSPPGIYARVLSRLGRPVSAEEVGPVFARVWAEAQLRADPGTDRYSAMAGGERAWWGGFVREVLTRLGHDADWREALDELYAEFTRPEVWHTFPGVEETLADLRRRGLPLAIISNWDSRLPALLDALGLARFFAVISVSSLEGVEKPAAPIFRRTVARLGVDPAAVLHVGDSPLEDYEGARRAGLVPVLLDRDGRFGINGFRTIARVADVVRLVDGPDGS